MRMKKDGEADSRRAVAAAAPQTLVDLLRLRARERPDAVLYRYLDQDLEVAGELTYRALDHHARAIGVHLLNHLSAGERALLVYPPGLDFVVAFLGALYGGMVPVPVYPPAAPRDLPAIAGIAADARVAALVTSEELLRSPGGGEAAAALGLPRLIAGRGTEGLEGGEAKAGGGAAPAWNDPGLTADHLAFLQYTSGSTGRPKGVKVSHAGLFSTLGDIDAAFRHGPQSVMVSWLPTFHDMGLIYGVLMPLWVGFPGYLMSPRTFLRRPIRWLEAISRYGGTHSAAPDFAYDLCVRKAGGEKAAGLDLRSWRVASSGAEPIRAGTLERFALAFAPWGFDPGAFCPSYGLAEATLKVTTTRAGTPPLIVHLDAAALEEGRVAEVAPGDSGVPLVGNGDSTIGAEILIVDPETREPLPKDRVGEIWVSSRSVAEGYWDRPQETEHTFRAATASGRGPFLRTGDLGFLLRDQLFVAGRIKDLIVIRGRNHYAHDLERTVESLDARLRPGCGAAFSVRGARGTEELVVLQEVRDDPGGEACAELLQRIRGAVAERHGITPGHVLLLPPGEILKTSSGKLRRSACRERFERGALSPLCAWHRESR